MGRGARRRTAGGRRAAASPTTALATTSTGWPRWSDWSPPRAWPIPPRFGRERRPGSTPIGTRRTAGPSNCFHHRQRRRSSGCSSGWRPPARCTGCIRQATGWSQADGPAVVPQLGWLASAGLGALLGMRHALEPDHLAAMSTLMTGERSSAKAAWLGACWGLGHTLTLLAAGTSWWCCGPTCPPAPLDVRAVRGPAAGGVRRARDPSGRDRGPIGPTHSHAAPGLLRRADLAGWTLARPLLVGAVHGLAGSGALTALVVATLPSTLAQTELSAAVRGRHDRGNGRALRAAGLAAGQDGSPSLGRAEPLGDGRRCVDRPRGRLGLPALRALVLAGCSSRAPSVGDALHVCAGTVPHFGTVGDSPALRDCPQCSTSASPCGR